MTFGRVLLLSQKYNILKKRRKKTTKVTLKVHDMKRERFNMFQITVFHATMYIDRGDKYV